MRRPRIWLAIPGIAALLIALAIGAARWAEGRAALAADRAAETLAAAHVGLLASELQKFRLLPVVLAEYPDVAAALTGADGGERLSATLEQFARRTDAAAIYVIDRRGRTVAASNWRLPTSFVGQDYGFRPYFVDAMRAGAAELFALGTVSGRPGLYLARRVDRDGRALGVIVVKVEFGALEANWARSPGITVATDSHGVILVTSAPAWRFRSTHLLDAGTLRDARRTLQFGASPPQPAPLAIDGRDATAALGDRPERYRLHRTASPLAAGELVHLAPLGPPLAAARLQAALWAAGVLLLAGIVGGVALRAAETRRLQRAARIALEREVASRTAELRHVNARLVEEAAEREAADHRYRAAREELAQANRLGSLGQITAGVAHEINQPVAAIRTFAENAAAFLGRGGTAQAGENLSRIVALTERIGSITAELRAFARRRQGSGGSVAIGEVVDGLLLLMGERVRPVLTVSVPDALRPARVAGERIRLEQVLVNLLQNALDAVRDRPRPRIRLAVEAAGDDVLVRVRDNGPGVAPALADTLFTPFATGRADGLGLGLAIARDIARDYGGDLVHRADADETEFVLRLRRG